MRKNKKQILFVCVILLFMLLPINVYAKEPDLDALKDSLITDIELDDIYSDEPDEDETQSRTTLADDVYTIEFDNVGSVKSTIPGKGTYESAVFWFDEGLQYDLLVRDYDTDDDLGGFEDYFGVDSGEELVNYNSGDTILANGEYSLLVYSDESSSWGQIEFRIENDLGIKPDIDDYSFDLDGAISTKAIEIIPEIQYDEDSGQMVYVYDGAVLCYTSVPIGGVAVNWATILSPEGLLTVQYNDKTISYPEDGTFTEPGFYDVMVSAYGTGEENSIYSFHIPFIIIDSVTNAFECIPAPLNFRFSDVRLDERPYEFSDDQLFLKDDGHYSVTVQSLDSPLISLTYNFELDTTPVEFVFDKEIKKGKIKGKVNVSLNDEGEIYIIEQGSAVPLRATTLQPSGSFKLLAKDKAGNETNITIFVVNSFDFANPKSYIVLGVIFVTVVTWFIVTRKNYRV